MSTNRTIVATAGLVLALIVLVGSVSAAPSISLSSTSGDVGDTVTITGTGFNASENVSVWWGTDRVFRDWSATSLKFRNITYPSINTSQSLISPGNVPSGGLNHTIADAQGWFKVKYTVVAPENWYQKNSTIDVTGFSFDGSVWRQIQDITLNKDPAGQVFSVNDPVVTINTTSGGPNTPIQINVSNLRRNDKIDYISFGIDKSYQPYKQGSAPHAESMTSTLWNNLTGKWGNVTTPSQIATATGGTFLANTPYTVTVQILKNGSTSIPQVYTCSDTFTYTGTSAGAWMGINQTTNYRDNQATVTDQITYDLDAMAIKSPGETNSIRSDRQGSAYPIGINVTGMTAGQSIAKDSITIGGVSTVHPAVASTVATGQNFWPVNLTGSVPTGLASVVVGSNSFNVISSKPYDNTSSNAGITLSKTSGVQGGDSINVYGYNFDTSINGTDTYTRYGTIRENLTFFLDTTAISVNDTGAGTQWLASPGASHGFNNTVVDSNGAVSVNFTVPAGISTGTHWVYAYQNVTSYIGTQTTGSRVLRAQATFTVPSAAGTPTVSLNTTSGPVGGGVLVTLRNFTAERAALTIDGTSLNSSMWTGTANGHPAKVSIPSKAGGTYSITAANSTTAETASASFTVVPRVTAITPAQSAVRYGERFTISGTGFDASQHYVVLWNPAEYGGTEIGDFFATSTGAIPTDTGTFTVPPTTNGKHIIDIAKYDAQTTSVLYGNTRYSDGSGLVNHTAIGATFFTVSPMNPKVNDRVTITGSNLQPYDNVTMTDWNGATATLNVGADGTSGPTTWVVPYSRDADWNPGVNYAPALTFTGSVTGNNYGTVNMLVYDNVTLTPSTGAPGQKITVTGGGFRNNVYYIFLNQTSTGQDIMVGSFTGTASRGEIPTGTTFTVPDTASGDYKVIMSNTATWPSASAGNGLLASNYDKPTFTAAGALDHITVSPDSASLDVGEDQQFTAKGYDADGNELTITPSWTSSNTTVARLDAPSKPGLVTAYAKGTSTITATATIGSVTKSDTATVTVGGAGPTPTIDSIVVSPSTWTMQVGEEKAMTAMGYSGTTPVTLTTATWSSDDTSIATVTGSAGSGTVTGAGQGTATISVTQEGVTGTATLNVYTDITDAYKDASTGKVEKANAVQAVNDYLFNDKLSKTDAVTVVNAYLFG